MSAHKQWLDNEYQQWVKALQESTVDNFGSHPMVKRMLGEVDKNHFNKLCEYKGNSIFYLLPLDNLGGRLIYQTIFEPGYLIQTVYLPGGKILCKPLLILLSQIQRRGRP